MSFTEYKSHVEEGDTVIVFLGYDSMFPLVAKGGETTQTKYGAIKHNWLIGHRYGTKLQCTKGWVYILYPTPELWTLSLPHRTQILYSTDIAMITLQLDLKPGSVVCESGTGSGSLSHAILRTIMPTGFLHTVEFHKIRSQTARDEFELHGYGENVTVYHRDVLEEGFPVGNKADAVFLDIPRPWDAIAHAVDALKKSGGRLCSFSPCMEQVQRTCRKLLDSGCFEDIETIELVYKPHNVRKTLLPIVDIGTTDPDVRKYLFGDLNSDPNGKILPSMYEEGDTLPVGVITTPESGSAKRRGERKTSTKNPPPEKRKRMEDGQKKENIEENEKSCNQDVASNKTESSVGSFEEAKGSGQNLGGRKGYTAPTCTKSMFAARTCSAPKEIYGHTGYLTFATYSPKHVK